MKRQQGLTLLEVVVSIGVLTIILSALTVATLSSLNNSTYSRNQNQATQYAQSALEGVREAASSDYQTFTTYTSGSYCYNDSCSAFSSNGCGGSGSSCGNNITRSIFSRYVTITQNDSSDCGATTTSKKGGTYVLSTVAWTDGKCTGATLCEKVVLSSCIAAHDTQTVQ